MATPPRSRHVKIHQMAGGRSATYQEPISGEPVIEWRAVGAGWVGRVGDDHFEARDLLEVAPTGGLHGGWTWRFPWEWGCKVQPDGLFPQPHVYSCFTYEPVRGSHSDLERAKEMSVICLRALWLARAQKMKADWDAAPGKVSP